MVTYFCLAFLAIGCMSTTAQQRPQPTAEQIERMKAIYLPSPPHRDLERLAGEWDVEAEYASGNKSVRANGRVMNRVALGGRFVVSEGRARAAEGTLDVESIFLFGYDGRTGEHTVVLLDTFGTYYVTAAGKAPVPLSEVVMRGETIEGNGTKKFEVRLRWVDRHTYRTEIVFRFADREPVIAVAATHRRRQ
jgi:hypothetical protein